MKFQYYLSRRIFQMGKNYDKNKYLHIECLNELIHYINEGTKCVCINETS